MASSRAPNPPASACNTLSASAPPEMAAGGGAGGGATTGGAATGTPTGPLSDATSATTAGGDTISDEATKAALAGGGREPLSIPGATCSYLRP